MEPRLGTIQRNARVFLTEYEWDLILRMALVLYPRTPNGLLMVGRTTEDLIRYGIAYLESIRESSSTAQSIWSDVDRTAPEEARALHKAKVPRGKGKALLRRARAWGQAVELKPWKRGYAAFHEEQKRIRNERRRNKMGGGTRG